MLGGRQLVKAGSGCFGNLALASDRPPVVCVPWLTGWRLSQCYSDFLLVFFLSYEKFGSCEQEQRGVGRAIHRESVLAGWG